MRMNFRGLQFELDNDCIYLVDTFGIAACKDPELKRRYNFCEVQIAGGNHTGHFGIKMVGSSETEKLKYVSYSESNNELQILQMSENIAVTTHFVAYDNTSTIRAWNTIRNMTDRPLVLEHASSFVCFGFGKDNADSVDNLYLHRFYNSWHIECQPVRLSFHDCGLFNGNNNNCKKAIRGVNNGSWSTKEQLPQAIIEDADLNKFLFFQIESNCSWFWEISDVRNQLYLNIGGPNMDYNGWACKLEPDEEFNTCYVAICGGDSINEVVGEMTKYRRNIVRRCAADKNLPTIFNEYMHLSWDSPNEERTAKIVSTIAQLGIKYYVIDCGWHDDCPVSEIYEKVGKWRSSSVRFPNGIQNTIELIHKNGMKAGLWLEPEIIGYRCEEMKEYYGEDGFLKRNGRPIINSSRMFLDFSNKKVVDYLNETVDTVVREYGANYMKFDYNQDVGSAVENNAYSLGEGVCKNAEAYCTWLKGVMDRHPNVIIEACSSGGQRMDYKTLAMHPLISTSDQVNYKRYPYIVANILAAVIPEQAAVWSYPVNSLGGIDSTYDESEESVNSRISEEQVIMNMINSLLGRMHLASPVHKLNDEKRKLIKEGIDYYNKIEKAKHNCVPYFPTGWAKFYQPQVVCGFIYKNTAYLAVYSLGNGGKVSIPIDKYKVEGVKLAYPLHAEAKIEYSDHSVEITLPCDYSARFIEVTFDKNS